MPKEPEERMKIRYSDKKGDIKRHSEKIISELLQNVNTNFWLIQILFKKYILKVVNLVLQNLTYIVV